MTQSELNQQIAAATGESLATIRDRGFSPLWPIPYEVERAPLIIDWHAADARSTVRFPE